MRTFLFRLSLLASTLALTSGAIGCGEAPAPTNPSAVSGDGRGGATLPHGSPAGSESEQAVFAQAAAGRVNPTDLEQRGWTCFVPPVPNRIVCGQSHQTIPPPSPPDPDRPATYRFLVFDASGRFVGTELLIRSDLYQGQICESTGAEYFAIPAIGYHECLHTVVADY